jgi:hypothetical protein
MAEDFEPKVSSFQSPCKEAHTLVHADRGRDYGPPHEDFERTAGMWKALFGWDVKPEQVALAMICVKLSRLQQTPSKHDSVVDIAGYAETYQMVMDHYKEA